MTRRRAAAWMAALALVAGAAGAEAQARAPVPAGWRVAWSEATGLPAHLWGAGIDAPGANADPARAEAAARATLDAWLDALAPGSKPSHWRLARNVVHGRGALRTVAFEQVVDGLPVEGGAVSVLYKRDRLIVITSSAWPSVVVAPHAPAPGLSILPIPRGGGAIAYRVVTTERRPDARIFRDATTGAIVGRESLRHDGSGTLRYDAPVRGPQGPRLAFPAALAGVTVDATPATTDAAGGFAYAGPGPAQVTTSLAGPRVAVTDAAGLASTTLSIPDGGGATWSAAADELADAQLSTFVHVNRGKAFVAAALDPALPWIEQVLAVSVNEPESCNAQSADDGLHFARAGSTSDCENTGRLSDVVHHELGHSLHRAARLVGGTFDRALSEGLSDYFAITQSDDPGLGRGLYRAEPDRPLRDLALDHVFDADDRYVTPHTPGATLAGALWDLRALWIARHGATDGARRTDELFYGLVQRATSVPGAYAEALAFDDDDGDLANGTPHRCDLDDVFSRHGLVDLALDLGIPAPTRDGHAFTLRPEPPRPCPATEVAGVEVIWSTDVTDDRVALVRDGDTWRGAIPTQPDHTHVDYRVEIRLANGTVATLPDNPGDPWLSFWVGPVENLYCTDFERDPFAEGWDHGLIGGNAEDEWQWGPMQSRPSAGDPPAAYSGARVVGTDLGQDSGDGLYPRGGTSYLRSPIVDLRGHTDVRVQFQRWLNVEDGAFDRADVFVEPRVVWENRRRSEGLTNVDTRDRQWRFFDLPIDPALTAAGTLQVQLRLQADDTLSFGGWTIDDFCIVARGTAGACDGGPCPPEEDPGGCCSTGEAGGDPRGPAALVLAAALFLRRRRRAVRYCKRP